MDGWMEFRQQIEVERERINVDSKLKLLLYLSCWVITFVDRKIEYIFRQQIELIVILVVLLGHSISLYSYKFYAIYRVLKI